MTKLPVELFATFGVGLGVGLLLHKYALAASSKDAITSTKGLSIEDQQDEVRRLVRPNILKLTPYRCARDDYSEGTLLDANENSLGPPLHDDHLLRDEGLERYPCPYQIDLKTAVANLRQRDSSPPLEDKHVFLGVGSDEVIDLMIRIACIPRVDSILITPPTYGMYRVCADIHDVNIIESPLVIVPPSSSTSSSENSLASFHINPAHILATVTPSTKVMFLCSPGNPTANSLRVADVETLLSSPDYNGFVVVDEAYIDFTGSSESSLAPLVTKYRRLVVTQTLSKGFGLAGIRLGIAFGDPELIQILSNVKAPYNINKLSSKVALDALANVDRLHANVRVILDEKQKVIDALQASPYVKAVYASDSNFVLFECANAYQVYRKMAENGVVIRYRGNQHLLNDCLRATIGSPEENHRMLTMFASVSAEVQQA
ncbi:histidinol-phosphate transaminase [Aphanomyces astaci]|uniref:histidinol-phosphate transaminase n=2 Tax=Aphanomyces astaci TaxID=112090 RepID=W4GGC8_APHAT|nr:histidinol-phosphate transaminase [Aphanomyces astaci]ETV78747.1 histidinol-phosphate transaminase [Aphanomyces astaci]|eukprot:XP_009831466.1 histidinol-phosphate transaminase [Aphanomyces astaci]